MVILAKMLSILELYENYFIVQYLILRYAISKLFICEFNRTTGNFNLKY